MSRNVLSWFPNVLTYGGEVIEYWIIMIIKNNYKDIWGHTLGIVGKHSLIKI
jgi:hypothetical protein